MRASSTAAIVVVFSLLCAFPSSAEAQKRLHWERFEVAAHLNADGTLTVEETHTMVFSGDWNGGERRFNIRPGQSLSVTGVFREVNGAWGSLSQDSSLDDIDEYAMTDAHTLRWRSRLASDPPFADTRIRYQIRYELTGILIKDEDRFRLKHDFVFPERDGAIEQFELRLTLDPEWQPTTPVQSVYTAGPLAPRHSYVVEVPLRFSGTGTPVARDLSRSPEIVLGVSVLLGVTILAIAGLLIREHRFGRFAPLATNVDEAWIREHILKHPAEVVAAAWDENVGSAEVVALIARMVADGQLESTVGKGKNAEASMALRLKARRETLNGHERALIDKLFFNDRTDTSTSAVRSHYKKTGFHPAEEIRPELEAAVDALIPPGKKHMLFNPVSIALLVVGLGLVMYWWFQGYPGGFALLIPMIAVTGIGWVCGLKFRSYLHWGFREAALCLIPVFAVSLGAAAYLWFYAGAKLIQLQPFTVYGMVSVALACVLSSVRSLKSRRSPSAIRFRKILTAGREYFIRELARDAPALRDEWYPWLLGLELSKQVDAWTTQRTESGSGTSRSTSFGSSSSSSSGSPSFSGFTGGSSGGAGASASWVTAASGMAASVSPPSSSGSGGSSSGGGSSGGGSSGGGGGGGW